FEEVFEDFLPRVGEDARGEGSKDDFFFRHTQHCHRFIMFIFHVLQVGILLIVRECDAQNFGLARDVMEQRAASQLDIVWVRAEEEDSLAEEVHNVLMSLRGGRSPTKQSPRRWEIASD